MWISKVECIQSIHKYPFLLKINLGDLSQLISIYDIFCLQETYLEQGQNVNLQGYEHFRSERTKKRKAVRNSGGVMILYKSNLISGITRMPSSSKHFIWVKLDSNFFGLNEDIFVSGVYLPPSNSNYYKDQYIDIIDKLRSDIIKYSSQGQIIINGDLNS